MQIVQKNFTPCMGFHLRRSPSANDKVSCFLPSLNTTAKGFGIGISKLNIFGCLTGSARFLGSGSVEDNLLILREGGKF
jgi:hypothetical protein